MVEKGKGCFYVMKFTRVSGPSITFVAALAMLFGSVAALLLANSQRDQLEEAQGQLQDTQSELQAAQGAQQKASKAGAGPTTKQQPGTNKIQPQDNTTGPSPNPNNPTPEDQQQAIPVETQTYEGVWQPYLLLLSLGLVVLVSFILAVASALALVRGNPRSGKSLAKESRAPSTVETSNLQQTTASKDGAWIELVEECVGVVDELDRHMDSFDAPRREVAGHVVLRLEEILGRSGVEIIWTDETFDRARHKPDVGDATAGAAVAETLSPGFAVGPRVLRRARVRLE